MFVSQSGKECRPTKSVSKTDICKIFVKYLGEHQISLHVRGRLMEVYYIKSFLKKGYKKQTLTKLLSATFNAKHVML